MMTLIVAVFVASLMGSLHCAGMCGAFVALSVGVDQAQGSRRTLLHAAYHGGRLVTYTLLGAVAGGLGAALDLSGTVFGLQRAAMIVAGLGMVVFGTVTLLRLQGIAVPRAGVPAPLGRLFQRGHAFAMRRRPATRALTIGLLTTLLPCGWLYAFAITAAGTGSAPLGALTMAVFWLGTVPVLVGLGVGVQRLAGPLRRHVPTVTAAALVLVGVVALAGRFNVPALAATTLEPTDADAIARVQALDAGAMPCCNPE